MTTARTTMQIETTRPKITTQAPTRRDMEEFMGLLPVGWPLPKHEMLRASSGVFRIVVVSRGNFDPLVVN